MDIDEVASKPAVTCSETATLAQVAAMMREHDIGAVVVTDADRRPVGIVTDRDLTVRAVAAGRSPASRIGDVMSRDVASISWDKDALDAARQMGNRECRRLPVIDGAGRVIGVVTLDDLLVRTAHTIEELGTVLDIERSGRSFRSHVTLRAV